MTNITQGGEWLPYSFTVKVITKFRGLFRNVLQVKRFNKKV